MLALNQLYRNLPNEPSGGDQFMASLLASVSIGYDMSRIGILAYGSLIEEPGVELEPLICERVVDVETPFNIEFARSSRTRNNAPTVVPVVKFGAPVNGVILVLNEGVELSLATDFLWRRETRSEGSDRHYRHSSQPRVNQVTIAQIEDLNGVDTVIFTRLAANIPNPTPKILAHLAVKSASGRAGFEGKDGISYLMSLKRQNIKTPLMEPYEAEILSSVGASSLKNALARVRLISSGGHHDKRKQP